MRAFDCDLHFHSPYAGGVSKHMSVPVLAKQAQLKGLHAICTADVTHKDWLAHLREHLTETENGVYAYEGTDTKFIVGTELEGAGRVHHLVYLESLEAAQELRKKLAPHGNLDGPLSGRPRIRLDGEGIARAVEEVGGICGPAHAFTPYFGALAHFDSVRACYGEMADKITFLELGLSADSDSADLIASNHDYAFVTFSDSHSPWPHRIGREFSRIEMKSPAFSELKKALARKGENKITLNAGLDPREGKYHATACNACFRQYDLVTASSQKWKCACGGSIKKGVRERIAELATYAEQTHPAHRPPYLHLLPLAEIIQLALGAAMPTSKAVQDVWQRMVDAGKSEINVLVDEPVVNLADVHPRVARYITAFREGWVLFNPGGGGQYGKPEICLSKEAFESKKMGPQKPRGGQKSLFEF